MELDTLSDWVTSINMINFLIDNIFIEFEDRIFQHTVSIPMGTNCAPLLVDLFLHSYEADIVQELLRKGEKKLAQSFNYTFHYIDDVLSLNNKNFTNFLHLITIYMQWVELLVKDTTDFPNSASYLDFYLEPSQPDFLNLPIVNYPFLDSNIGVYISRICNSY